MASSKWPIRSMAPIRRVRPPSGGYAILGLFIILFLPVMYILDPPDSPTLFAFIFYAGLFALFVFMGVNAFVSHCSVYSVNPTEFSKLSPIGIGSWTMQPYDLVAADLEFVKFTRVLVLRSANGKTKRIPTLWRTRAEVC